MAFEASSTGAPVNFMRLRRAWACVSVEPARTPLEGKLGIPVLDHDVVHAKLVVAVGRPAAMIESVMARTRSQPLALA